ncbi:MAG: zinc ribbon domain-containing protein [Candidatus Cloacimonetes bacterium]|nr:zinc ribbon domain-containing protein [Candidatus Cloacimonadota bacterium]
MLDLIRKMYKNWLEILAWIVVIIGGCIGSVIFAMMNENLIILGMVLGGGVGFIINVLILGLISTVVEMAVDMREIKTYLINEVQMPRVEVKQQVCNKCGSGVQKDDLFCQNCGEKVEYRHDQSIHSNQCRKY